MIRIYYILSQLIAIFILTLFFGNWVFAEQVKIKDKPYYVEYHANGTVSALRLEVSPISGQRVSTPSALSEEKIVNKALTFIDENPDLFQVDVEDLHVESVKHIGNRWRVTFLQLFEGVVVFNSQIEIELTDEGDVVSASTRDLFTGSIDTSFTVEKKNAVEAALAHCESLPDCTRDANPLIKGYLAIYSYEPLEGEKEFRLSWYLSFKQREYVVDANTGEILADFTNIIFIDVTGKVEGNHTNWGQVPGTPNIQERLEGLRVNLSTLTGVIEITINVAANTEPVISGNGEVIVFVSDIDGDREIYKVNYDGTGLVKLTNNDVQENSPDISDDASLIVFVSNVGGEENIFRINADGTGLAQVTGTGTGNNRTPSLSGDGTKIAFVSDRTGNNEIFLINPDGSAEAQLTSNGAENKEPSINYDSSLIVYSSNVANGYEIYSVQGDGSALTQITFNTADAIQPSISDQGNKIAITSDNDGDNEIYILDFDVIFGWILRQLTTNATANDMQPDLSGDGTKVAYASDRDGEFEIFTINADGSLDTQITFNLKKDWRPSISDDANRLVYASETNNVVRIFVVGLAVAVKSTYTFDDIPFFLSMNPLDNHVDLPGGDYSLTCPGGSTFLSARLSGKNVTVKNQGGANQSLSQSVCPPYVVDMLFNPAGGPDTDTAQVNAYYFTDAIYSYLDNIYGRNPIANPLSHITANVNLGGSCNAFYNPALQTINFLLAGGGCPNTTYDTVLFHEYGHFLDDRFGGIPFSTPGRGLSEGIADMTALYASGFAANPNSAIVGEDFRGLGIHLRDYNPGGNWHDMQLENLHTQGIYRQGGAFAGFAWQSRENLIASLGPGGINVAEDIFFTSLSLNRQNVRDAAIQVFYQDDNPIIGGGNIEIRDETPHYDDLRIAACRHGLDAVPYPGSPWGEMSFDYGDAPNPYPTEGPEAARHGTIGCERLGLNVSRETSERDNVFDEDPQTNLAPFDTDSDDGVHFIAPFMPEGTGDIDVTVSVAPQLLNTGRYNKDKPTQRLYMNSWMDWNGDGNWEVTEKIIGTGSPTGTWHMDPNENDPDHGFEGVNTKTFRFQPAIPKDLTDKPFAGRFRLDYGENAGRVANPFSDPTLQEEKGRARYGEVEDCLLCINQVENGEQGNIIDDAADKLNEFFDLLDRSPQGTETLFSEETKHAFFGISPPLAGSRAILMINEDNDTFRFIADDNILLIVDTGALPIQPTIWRELGDNPKRVVFIHTFEQGGDTFKITGNALLLPYNRVVVDIVNQSAGKRVRYLLKDCYNMAKK